MSAAVSSMPARDASTFAFASASRLFADATRDVAVPTAVRASCAAASATDAWAFACARVAAYGRGSTRNSGASFAMSTPSATNTSTISPDTRGSTVTTSDATQRPISSM